MSNILKNTNGLKNKTVEEEIAIVLDEIFPV
jgi:hypothetical protein